MTTLRRIRIGLDATIILLAIVIIILCGIELRKYPGDGNSTGNGEWTMGALGGPACLMVVCCSVDLLMHHVGSRNGIHRKTALDGLVICLIGILAADVAALVLRFLITGSGPGPEDDGDEYLWPSFALAITYWCCLLALCVTIGKQPKTIPKDVDNNKLDDGSVA